MIIFSTSSQWNSLNRNRRRSSNNTYREYTALCLSTRGTCDPHELDTQYFKHFQFYLVRCEGSVNRLFIIHLHFARNIHWKTDGRRLGTNVRDYFFFFYVYKYMTNWVAIDCVISCANHLVVIKNECEHCDIARVQRILIISFQTVNKNTKKTQINAEIMTFIACIIYLNRFSLILSIFPSD